MTEEQQRIAIAEACGWEIVDFHPGDIIPENVPAKRVYWDPKRRWKSYPELPDYPGDLNAMHEAVRTLPSLTIFKGHLMGVYSRDGGREGDFFMANPRQWAEAFLHTIGKWQQH